MGDVVSEPGRGPDAVIAALAERRVTWLQMEKEPFAVVARLAAALAARGA